VQAGGLRDRGGRRARGFAGLRLVVTFRLSRSSSISSLISWARAKPIAVLDARIGDTATARHIVPGHAPGQFASGSSSQNGPHHGCKVEAKSYSCRRSGKSSAAQASRNWGIGVPWMLSR
jgi:hypothetical protein